MRVNLPFANEDFHMDCRLLANKSSNQIGLLDTIAADAVTDSPTDSEP